MSCQLTVVPASVPQKSTLKRGRATLYLCIATFSIGVVAGCSPAPNEQNAAPEPVRRQSPTASDGFALKAVVSQTDPGQGTMLVELPFENPPRKAQVRAWEASIWNGMGAPISKVTVLNRLKIHAVSPGQELLLAAQLDALSPLSFEKGQYVLRKTHILGPQKGETEVQIINGDLVTFVFHPQDPGSPIESSPFKPVCDAMAWFIRAELAMTQQNKDIDTTLKELSPVPDNPELFLMMMAMPDDQNLAAQLADSLQIPPDLFKGLAQDRVPNLGANQQFGRALAVVLLGRRGLDVSRALPGLILTMANEKNLQGYAIRPILDCLAHFPPEIIRSAFDQCEPVLKSDFGMRQLVLECEASASSQIKDFGEKIKLFLQK